jgi:Uma2 family endonuclease
MSEPYQEILESRTFTRPAPGPRHEQICARLHKLVHAAVADSAARLLPARSEVRLSFTTSVRPDLALVTAATGKLWLAAEIVSSDDHRADTVIKKEIYEHCKLPRLWMIDPRYDNVEVYHSTEHGLALKGILAGGEILSEQLLPEFEVTIVELFSQQP